MKNLSPNKLANDPKFRTYVQQWVRETCPLIYIFAPSNTGKTTLLGSLFPNQGRVSVPVWTFEHDDYCPSLFIDADNGGTTIEELAGDEDHCKHWEFDEVPELLTAWTYDKIELAKTTACGSILIEGLSSVHTRLVANETKKMSKPDKTGAMNNDLRRSYIGASSHCKGILDSIKQVKQYRRAKKTGVPIIVTLNTKSVSIDKNKPDSPKRVEPDWGINLIEHTKRSCDAHLELMRDPNTGRTQLISTAITGSHPHCKLRSPAVANKVQAEYNMSLPGLLALWAVEAGRKKKQRAATKAKLAAAKTTETTEKADS